MKKFLVVLLALLLVASLTVVQAEGNDENGLDEDDDIVEEIDIEVDEDDDEIGTTLAEIEVPTETKLRSAVSRLHLTAKGLAISEDDAFDFLYAKIVIGAVRVRIAGEENVVSALPYLTKRLGVLKLNEQNYHLKDIAVSTDEISAEVFGPTTEADSNSPSIGEIKLTRFEKPGRDVWAGNLVINNDIYNVYFLGVKRYFRLEEVTTKIGEYCEENAEDTRCKNIVSECARNTESCKNRVTEYCENNTSDQQCLQLKKLYCLKNASDERCRNYLEELCTGNKNIETNKNLAHCRVKNVSGEEVVSIDATVVSAVTAERGETARNLVATKAREKLQNVKNRVGSTDLGEE